MRYIVAALATTAATTTSAAAAHSDEEMEEQQTSSRGTWEGSYITAKEIQWLRQTRRIPAGVDCRAPSGEISPDPEQGERVVFLEHFVRGLGLPASTFFRQFLDKFNLQPHHLPPNALLFLSSFVSFQEGYLGLWPNLDLWVMLHTLFPQSVPNPKHKGAKAMVTVGAAQVKPRQDVEFFRVKGLASCKKWLRSWFYVKNQKPGVDLINLPDYQAGPPVEKFHWEYYPTDPQGELKGYCSHILELIGKGELKPDDLVTAFIARRLSPLQRRTHKMCHYSGRLDPNRITTIELPKPDICKKVKAICKTQMEETWEWGLEPYSRANLPPAVSRLCQ